MSPGDSRQRGGKLVFAVCNQPFNNLDELPFGHAEIIDQKLGVVSASEMCESLEACLPIADVLDLAAVLKKEDPARVQEDWQYWRGHTFRHTVGTMLAEMGEHQLTIRDYLRHSNLHEGMREGINPQSWGLLVRQVPHPCYSKYRIDASV